MYLLQMLKQSRVTLKKDTLPHMHTLLYKLHSASEQRNRVGEFYFQEAFCAYLCGETIEREGKRRRRGRDCVRERVSESRGGLVGESGWESAAEREGGRRGLVTLAESPAVCWSEAVADV